MAERIQTDEERLRNWELKKSGLIERVLAADRQHKGGESLDEYRAVLGEYWEECPDEGKLLLDEVTDEGHRIMRFKRLDDRHIVVHVWFRGKEITYATLHVMPKEDMYQEFDSAIQRRRHRIAGLTSEIETLMKVRDSVFSAGSSK